MKIWYRLTIGERVTIITALRKSINYYSEASADASESKAVEYWEGQLLKAQTLIDRLNQQGKDCIEDVDPSDENQ